MISFKINDVALDIASKAIYNRNRKERADSGSVTLFNEVSTRYEPYSRVEINNEQYLIESDNLVQQRGSLYEHNLTLIENIAKLATIHPVDRSFKRVPALTIGDILEIYQRELAFYQDFEFTYDETDTIYDTKMVDKEYAGVDFAVIVYDLFRSINAIPRLTWDNGWVLSYELYTEVNDLVTLNVENRQSNVNDIDYATQLLAKTRNAVSEDDGYIYWPSANTYMTPRAKGTMYKTSDLQYELDSEIMAIYEVCAEVPCTAVIYTGGENTTYNRTVHVNITQGLKEAEVYESLSLSTDNNPEPINTYNKDGLFSTVTHYKQNSIRYTKETNIIDSLWFKRDGIIFSSNVTALFNLIQEYVNQSFYEEYPDLIPSGTFFSCRPNAIDVEDIPIRVKYRPRRDIDFVTEKNSVLGFNKATILNNQKDSVIEIGRYLQNSNAIVNRIGNQVNQVTQSFDTFAEAWKLGDYYLVGNDRWIITDITYSEDKNLVTCDAEFTLNFSNVNRETSITRQPSPYLYTGKGVQSNFIYKEYLEFAKTLPAYNGDSILTTTAKRIAMNIFDYSATYDKPLRHLIYRRIGTNDYIDKQLFTAGSGNVILFHAAFNDARLAGKAFKKVNGSWYQDPIWYVSEWTEALASADITLSNTHTLLTDTDDYKYYPLVDDDDNTYTRTVTLRFDKDPNDKLAITYEIIPISNSNDIIVGNGFTRFNNLIKDLGSASLDLYSADEPYTMFDKVKGTLISGNIDLYDTYIEVTDALSDAIQYWAIVYNNEIVLAANNSVSKVYYRMTRYRTYDVVIEIVNLVVDIEMTEEDILDLEMIIQYNEVVDIVMEESDTLTLEYITVDTELVYLEMTEEDSLVISYEYQDNELVNIIMEESDNLSLEYIVTEVELVSVEMEEEDNLSLSYEIIENTKEPTVTFVSWTEGLGPLDEFLFQVKNNDGNYAEIFADENSTPTSSAGWVAPNSSVNVTLLSSNTSVTCYARARAEDENYSTVDSAVGTVV